MNRDHNQQHVRRGPHLVRAAGPADLADRRVKFKLKEDLTIDALVPAWEMPWNPETEEYDDPEETEIHVKDYLGVMGFVGPTDAEGVALRRHTNTGIIYEIVELQPVALVASASVDDASDVAASDATFAIDNVTIISPPGATIYLSGSAPTVCNNAMGVPTLDNATVTLLYNHNTGLWEGFPLIDTTECP